jgi:hypothetical protein
MSASNDNNNNNNIREVEEVEEEEGVDVYFKKARTVDTKFYKVNPQWTRENFMNIMKRRIPIDFDGIEKFELVATGQHLPQNADGTRIDAEDGAPLVLDNTKLCSIYGPDINVAFYIRLIPLAVVVDVTVDAINVTTCDIDVGGGGGSA